MPCSKRCNCDDCLNGEEKATAGRPWSSPVVPKENLKGSENSLRANSAELANLSGQRRLSHQEKSDRLVDSIRQSAILASIGPTRSLAAVASDGPPNGPSDGP